MELKNIYNLTENIDCIDVYLLYMECKKESNVNEKDCLTLYNLYEQCRILKKYIRNSIKENR